MDFGSLISAGLPLVNQFLNKGSQNKANNAANAGINAYQNLTLPQLQQLLYNAKQSTAAGPYDAAQAQTVDQGTNAFNNINLNPAAQAAESSALGQLQGIAANNGITPQTAAQLAQIRAQGNANEKGQRDAIMQSAASRGVGGSQMALASALANEQGAADRNAAGGYQAAADAANRAQNAIGTGANLAGTIYSQQYGAAQNQANAQNAINNFNAAAKNAASAQNATATNTALNQGVQNQQATNLANQAATNAQYQNNATNTLALSGQGLTRAGGIAGAAPEAAKFNQNVNKMNQSADSGLLGYAGDTLSDWLK